MVRPPQRRGRLGRDYLDVQQSGGISPGAKVLIYEAPNTNQGFIDAFAKAIDANKADTISTSWGQWEYLDEIPPAIEDPVTGRATNTVRALNDLFLEAALQGQTLFCAAGDDGAYDARTFPQPGTPPPFAPPVYTTVLSVDDPAAQQFIVAAGGTTLPGRQVFTDDSGKTIFVAKITAEQVWGWDYLQGLCKATGVPDPVACGIFPAGGGGRCEQLRAPAVLPIRHTRNPRHRAGAAVDRHHQAEASEDHRAAACGLQWAKRARPVSQCGSGDRLHRALHFRCQWGNCRATRRHELFGPPAQRRGIALHQALGQRLGLMNVPLYDLVRRRAAYGGGARAVARYCAW